MLVLFSNYQNNIDQNKIDQIRIDQNDVDQNKIDKNQAGNNQNYHLNEQTRLPGAVPQPLMLLYIMLY